MNRLPTYKEVPMMLSVAAQSEAQGFLMGVALLPTGTWKTKKPIIDGDTCSRCKLCLIFCPDGAIYEDNEGAIGVAYNWCKGCGICANECPVKAIEMVRE